MHVNVTFHGIGFASTSLSIGKYGTYNNKMGEIIIGSTANMLFH